jgi:hypothetical protein
MSTIQSDVRRFFSVVGFASLVGTGGAGAGHPQPAARAGLPALRPAFSPRAEGNTDPATSTDPSGDSGTAPDIANVVVSNDTNGQITLRIYVAKMMVPSSVQIVVAVDSDQNAQTGLSGTDYLLLADA